MANSFVATTQAPEPCRDGEVPQEEPRAPLPPPPPPPPRIPAQSTLSWAPRPLAGLQMKRLGDENLLPSWKLPHLVSEVLVQGHATAGQLTSGFAGRRGPLSSTAPDSVPAGKQPPRGSPS